MNTGCCVQLRMKPQGLPLCVFSPQRGGGGWWGAGGGSTSSPCARWRWWWGFCVLGSHSSQLRGPSAGGGWCTPLCKYVHATSGTFHSKSPSPTSRNHFILFFPNRTRLKFWGTASACCHSSSPVLPDSPWSSEQCVTKGAELVPRQRSRVTFVMSL